MHQYTVELRIAGQDLDPDEITRSLGISPTQVRRKGERRSGASVWTENMWAYEVFPSQRDSWSSLSDGLTSLLNEVLPLKTRLQSFASANKIYLWCGHFTTDFDGGPTLPPELLKLLGEFGVGLELDTYHQSAE